MKIIIEEPSVGEEEQIIIKCHQMTPELTKILAELKTVEAIVGYRDNKIYRIRPNEIYYVEVVDNNTFIYCQDSVYETKQKLYELEESLDNGDFLRISKSVILNLSIIKSLSPALNGRFEAELYNNEKQIISRQYVADLKKRLGL